MTRGQAVYRFLLSQDRDHDGNPAWHGMAQHSQEEADYLPTYPTYATATMGSSHPDSSQHHCLISLLPTCLGHGILVSACNVMIVRAEMVLVSLAHRRSRGWMT